LPKCFLCIREMTQVAFGQAPGFKDLVAQNGIGGIGEELRLMQFIFGLLYLVKADMGEAAEQLLLNRHVAGGMKGAVAFEQGDDLRAQSLIGEHAGLKEAEPGVPVSALFGKLPPRLRRLLLREVKVPPEHFVADGLKDGCGIRWCGGAASGKRQRRGQRYESEGGTVRPPALLVFAVTSDEVDWSEGGTVRPPAFAVSAV
jgi:hypothetical protein